MAGREAVVALCERLFPDAAGGVPCALIPAACSEIALGGRPLGSYLVLDPFLPPSASEPGRLGLSGLWGRALGCGAEEAFLAELGATQIAVGRADPGACLLKLVVYVPPSHLQVVREAICGAGAGAIGAYGECTFVSMGTGTFRPGPDTRPFVGEEGKLEQVEEARLETVLFGHHKGRVISALLAAHPYEEPAYDLFRLEGGPAGFGAGRVGALLQPSTPEGLSWAAGALLGGEIYLFGEALPVHTVGANFGRMEDALDADLSVAPLPQASGATLCVPPWRLAAYAARIFEAEVKRHAGALGVPVRGTLQSPWKKMD